ncbi:MAG: hypothetical protein HY049_06685 [Acidobacteria bacterium]|nr:hypothetical protein [Acidobacteriota bacterium]
MTHRPLPLIAVIALLLAVPFSSLSARQFEPPPKSAGDPAEQAAPAPDESAAPTVDSILEAHRAGKPAADIVAWIEGSGAHLSLSLAGALTLRRAGLPSEVIASASGENAARIDALLAKFPMVAPATAAGPGDLSRRQILKMLHAGTPEPEVLDAIASQGSKGSLSLHEAIALENEGISATLLVAIAGEGPRKGALAEIAAAAPAAAVTPPPAASAPEPTLDEVLEAKAAAAPAAGGETAPTLDEALGGDEAPEAEEPGETPEATPDASAPTLDQILPEEEEEAAAEPPESIDTYLSVLSDPADSRLSIAPASTRLVDLLAQSKSAGRAPAQISLAPGAWFLIVEKRIDAFENGILPAMRTVLDGDGATRTLIASGDISYDAAACCAPKSLSGPLSISRISQDQQSAILGDEFDGLPPYLWDGNRYLILSIRDGRIRRALKVYVVKKAAGESRTLTATFLPTSSPDTLAAAPPPAEGETAVAPGEAEIFARESWTPPTRDELAPIARFYGVPTTDNAKLAAKLAATGKAVVRRDGDDGTVSLVAFSLDSNSRVRAEEFVYRKDGPYGALSTPVPPPPPKHRKKAKPVTLPAPLEAVQRVDDPTNFLPFLTVSNKSKSIALVRLWDGTAIFVAGGTSKDLTVSPGSGEIEARFGDNPAERRVVQAHFTYHEHYTLKLD